MRHPYFAEKEHKSVRLWFTNFAGAAGMEATSDYRSFFSGDRHLRGKDDEEDAEDE